MYILEISCLRPPTRRGNFLDEDITFGDEIANDFSGEIGASLFLSGDNLEVCSASRLDWSRLTIILLVENKGMVFRETLDARVAGHSGFSDTITKLCGTTKRNE
jgi:hypothetical protein